MRPRTPECRQHRTDARRPASGKDNPKRERRRQPKAAHFVGSQLQPPLAQQPSVQRAWQQSQQKRAHHHHHNARDGLHHRLVGRQHRPKLPASNPSAMNATEKPATKIRRRQHHRIQPTRARCQSPAPAPVGRRPPFRKESRYSQAPAARHTARRTRRCRPRRRSAPRRCSRCS